MILLNDTIGVATQLLVIQDSDPRHESQRDSNIFLANRGKLVPHIETFSWIRGLLFL